MKQVTTTLTETMAEKLELLEKISTNTKVQIDFIHQRKTKGLLRLLNERAQYLQELEAINRDIKASDGRMSGKEAEKIIQQINIMQQEILKDNDEALCAAKAERDSIAADLRRVNSQKKMHNSYDRPLLKFSGNRFNQKG